MDKSWRLVVLGKGMFDMIIICKCFVYEEMDDVNDYIFYMYDVFILDVMLLIEMCFFLYGLIYVFIGICCLV